MRIFAVGDIQGCADELHRLLDAIGFDPSNDRLWCVGDLVNRGPKSLKTLRFLASLGERCVAVLGNHDLHLLGCFAGVRRPDSGLAEILEAPDAAFFCDWLRRRTLVHEEGAWAMVHAGFAPQWDWETIRTLARAIEARLQSEDWQAFVQRYFAQPTPTQEPQDEEGRLFFALSVFTRARYCRADGFFDWHTRAGAPADPALRPWFAHESLRWRKQKRRVIFGHWAAKGLVLNEAHVLGLDAGCVWGGRLAAARLVPLPVEVFTVPCRRWRKIEEA